ncbi:EAL domain-containing protein [Acidocella sp.]|uniref:EAL domain-containing protein n=1 Tax=Acidocella sp. TaxID=50710 RepID=UPI0026153A6C|nr:EAL domain-containing protein [Acidocella sp.]
MPSSRGTQLLASLRLLYQPVVRIDDGITGSAEVLARFAGDNGEISGPAGLLAAMSDGPSAIGLSVALMRLGLAEHAASGLAALGLPLAFNLTLDALLHPALLAHVLALCAEFSLPAAQLRFELTEEQPVRDLGATGRVIAALHQAGFALALDDITPAMPNLEALMDMPISAVKLDKSLLSGADAFLARIIPHARARGLAVIAEGIETQPQHHAMRAVGATHGQGYYYAKPLSATALAAFLRR